MHVLEEKFKVPYRSYKEFSGPVDFGDGQIECTTRMYVRNLADKKNTVMESVQDLLKEKETTFVDDALQLYAYDNIELLHAGEALLKENIYALYGYRNASTR